MRSLRLLLPLSLLWFPACASSSGGGASAKAGAPDRDASSAKASELTVSRPDGWSFIPVDASVPADVALLLIGPNADTPVAPMVQVVVRPRTAQAQRWGASQVLETTMDEITQLFAGVETTSGPDEIDIAGQKGARTSIKMLEAMPDGSEQPRSGRFYALVTATNIYVIRCIGPADGSADGAFDSIVGSLTL